MTSAATTLQAWLAQALLGRRLRRSCRPPKRLLAEKHGQDHLLKDRQVERFKRHGRQSGRRPK
jgi:hypothetical protein